MLYDLYAVNGYDVTDYELRESGKTEDEINEMLNSYHEGFDCMYRPWVTKHGTMTVVRKTMDGGKLRIMA